MLRSVDAGGGLGIDYHAGKFDARAKVREYATAIEGALEGFDGRLLLEPGRFLVAQAGALVARVLQVKRNGKKTFVITDAAMNDLIRPALYQAHHEIVPVRPRAGKARVVDVVGPVCETGTFLRAIASWRPWSRATWWRCWMRALTAWRKARTTTRVRVRRRCWWKARGRG